MMLDTSLTPIRHLMIFLREMPSDGMDDFERQIIHHTTYATEGSNDKSILSDRINDETKIKILVTGEIELNEKNVFVGLKMAFPEWDFQRYPLNIQKLFLKKPLWVDPKEVGVIATTDLAKSSGGNQWGAPCVLDISPNQVGPPVRSASKENTASWYERISSGVLKNEDLEDFSDTFFNTEKDIEETQEALGEIDFAGILDLAEDISNREPSSKTTFNASESMDLEKELPAIKETKEEEAISGVESKEILKHFEVEKKASSLTGTDEDEGFDFSFLDEASTFSPTSDGMDLKEKFPPRKTFGTRPFLEEDEDYISPEFLEPEIEFELEGFVEENQAREDPSLLATDNDDEFASSSTGIFQEALGKIQSALSNKIKELPLRKIGLTSLIAGLAVIALSFVVMVFEPDYETIRKDAGVVDLYDWIIINDLVGPDTETDALIDRWKESSEYRQFWAWFDTEWSPKITRYKNIERGIRTTGIILISPFLLILIITVADRIGPIFRKEKQISNYEPTNRISLGFNTYSNDWSLVDAWAKETGFKILEVEGSRRLYRKKGNLAHPPILCLVVMEGDQVQLEVWVSTRAPTFLIPLLSDLGLEVLEAKDSILPASIKNTVNKLILKLGHPPLA
jgi:hypothetical protein